MSEWSIVKNRLHDIVPQKRLASMERTEVNRAVDTAFEIINYRPKNLDKAKYNAWKHSNAIMLYEFIYDVWRCDNEHQ